MSPDVREALSELDRAVRPIVGECYGDRVDTLVEAVEHLLWVMREAARPAPSSAVDQFNEAHPIGAAVRYWPGVRIGAGRWSTTRSAASLLGGHSPVVMVEGYPGCIALTHVEVVP